MDFAGPKGLVVFFWAGWSERSLEELKRLDAAQKEMRDHGVGVVAVNADGAGASGTATAKDKPSALGVTLPVVVDEGLKLFNAYGVVSVPSTALLNEKGELAFFLAGYSHEQREDLFDAIDRLAGVTHAAPAGPTVRAAPAAVRRLLFGRAQLAGGRLAAARSSFEAAAAADAAFVDPLVELAAIDVDEGRLTEARAWLDKAQTLDAAYGGIRVERARLRFVEGDTTGAVTTLAAESPADALAQAYLGWALLAAARADEASIAFAHVLESGLPDPRTGADAAPSLTPADAARRMAEFRRTLAGRRRE